MRLLPILLVLLMIALQAHAQPAPPSATAPVAAAPAAAAPAAAAPAAAAPAAQARSVPKPRRMTWQQRFAEANTTHDGHLTQQQAEAGYRAIASHFSEMDADKKGYVTVEDIANWHKLQRAMRHSHQGRALQPRPAMQRDVVQPHQINMSTAVAK